MIKKLPLYVDLDRRRELTFNLNTEITICSAGGQGARVLETVGTNHNEETGEDEPILRVNGENLRLYLWAALLADAQRQNEKLTIEDVGGLIDNSQAATDAAAKVLIGLNQYYGDQPKKG
jgi:hypothetical protein